MSVGREGPGLSQERELKPAGIFCVIAINDECDHMGYLSSSLTLLCSYVFPPLYYLL